MAIEKLVSHPYANAHIIIENDYTKYTLVSYSTPVAVYTIEDGEPWFECRGLYSATTRKHISWFLREMTGRDCYHLAKRIAGDNKKVNLFNYRTIDL